MNISNIWLTKAAHDSDVPLKMIDEKHSPRVRAETHQETVDDYAQKIEGGHKFPKVRLCEFKGRYLIADGKHRIAAARKLKKDSISAAVIPVAEPAACLELALAENLGFGLRRSNADKRTCVESAVKAWPEKTAPEIAKLCGVHHDLAYDVMKPKPPQSEPSESEAGKPATPPDKPDSSPSKSSTPHKPENAGASAASPTPAPKAEEEATIVDSLDFIIPKAILPIWNRKHEVQDALSMLSKVKVGLESAIEEKDPLYAGLAHGEYQTIVAAIKNASGLIKLAMPYVVCPNCQGVNPVRNKCRQCRASGFVSHFCWNQQVPSELKAMRKIATAKQAEKKK